MPNVFKITISAVDRATAVAQKVNASIAKITRPITDVHASVAAFSKETGIDKLGRGLEKAGNVASDTARRIGSIAPPLAALTGLGTIAGIAAIAHGWGRTAVEVSNTASVIGISTDRLQKYRGAARLAGLSDADMTSGLKAVGSAFEDAAAGRDTFVAGVLASKNIGVNRMADGSVDTARALHDVANAASRITNAQARQKFLDIFGVGQLAPLLSKGGAAIDEYVTRYEKLNAVMTPAQIAQGQRYNEAMVALDASVTKLKNSVGASLAPAFARVAEQLIPIANQYGPKIANWIDSVNWDKAASDVGKVAIALGGLKVASTAISLITFAKPITAIAQMSKLLLPLVPTLGPLAALAAGGAYTIEKLKDSTDPGHFVGRNAGAPVQKPLASSQSNGSLWDRLTATGSGKFVPRFSSSAHGATAGGGAPVAIASDAASPAPVAVAAAPVAASSPALPSASGMPLGIRSNNPLNLSDNGVERVYATPEEGLAAAADNLRRNYAGLTIAQIQDKWTGGRRTGNSPKQIANYTRLMEQASGVAAGAVPNLSDPRVVSSLLGGMIRAENGSMPYSAQQLSAATLAGMRGAGAAPADSSGFAATPAAQQPDTPVTGSVQVDVMLHGAPSGSRVSVTSRGNVAARARIGTSALLEPSL